MYATRAKALDKESRKPPAGDAKVDGTGAPTEDPAAGADPRDLKAS
jgi:hypothetical protein